MPLLQEALDGSFFKVLQMDPAQVHGGPSDFGEVIALIEMRGFNPRSLHAQLVYVKFGGVKSSKIIDHPYHKLQGEVGL